MPWYDETHHTTHHTTVHHTTVHHTTVPRYHTTHSNILQFTHFGPFWSILVHILILKHREAFPTQKRTERTQRFINLFFISTSTILMLMFKTTIALATLAALTNGQTPPSKHEIKSLPGWSPAALPSAMYTGYLNAG
jgi:hypothetical protein